MFWLTSTVAGLKVTLKKWFPGAAACDVRTQDHVENVINAIMNKVAALLSCFILFTLLLVDLVLSRTILIVQMLKSELSMAKTYQVFANCWELDYSDIGNSRHN